MAQRSATIRKGKKTEVPTLDEVQAEYQKQGCPEAWTNYDELMTFTREKNTGGTNAIKVISVESVGDHGKKEGDDGYEAAEADVASKKGLYYPMGFKNEKPCYAYSGNQIYWCGRSWKGPGIGSLEVNNRSDGEHPKDARWPEGFVTKIKTMKINHSTWAEAIWAALPEFATQKIQERADRIAREKAEEEARIAREKAEEEARLAAEKAAKEAAEAAEAARVAEYERLTAAIDKCKELGLDVDTSAVADGPEQNSMLQDALTTASSTHWTKCFKAKFSDRCNNKDECYVQSKAGDWMAAVVKSKVSMSRTTCKYDVALEKNGKVIKVTVEDPKRILAKSTFEQYKELFGSDPPGAQ